MSRLLSERYYVSFEGSFTYNYWYLNDDGTAPRKELRDQFIALVRLNIGGGVGQAVVTTSITDRTSEVNRTTVATAGALFDSLVINVEKISKPVFCVTTVGDLQFHAFSITPLYTTESFVIKDGHPLEIRVEPLPDVIGPMLWLRYRNPSLENYRRIAEKIIADVQRLETNFPPFNVPSEDYGVERTLQIRTLVENIGLFDPVFLQLLSNAFFFNSKAWGDKVNTQEYLEEISRTDVSKVIGIDGYDSNEPKAWLVTQIERMASLVTGGDVAFTEVLVHKMLIGLNDAFGHPGLKEFEIMTSESRDSMELLLSKPKGSFLVIGYQCGVLNNTANNGRFATVDYSGFELGFSDQEIWTLRILVKVACLEDRRIIRKPFSFREPVSVGGAETWPYILDTSAFSAKPGQPPVPPLELFKIEGNYNDPVVSVVDAEAHPALPFLHTQESGIYGFSVSDADATERRIQQPPMGPLVTRIVNAEEPVNSKRGGNMVYLGTQRTSAFELFYHPFLLSVSPISQSIVTDLGHSVLIDFTPSFSRVKPPPGSILTWTKNTGETLSSLDQYSGRLVISFPHAAEENAGLYQLDLTVPGLNGNPVVHEVLQIIFDLSLR